MFNHSVFFQLYVFFLVQPTFGMILTWRFLWDRHQHDVPDMFPKKFWSAKPTHVSGNVFGASINRELFVSSPGMSSKQLQVTQVISTFGSLWPGALEMGPSSGEVEPHHDESSLMMTTISGDSPIMSLFQGCALLKFSQYMIQIIYIYSYYGCMLVWTTITTHEAYIKYVMYIIVMFIFCDVKQPVEI